MPIINKPIKIAQDDVLYPKNVAGFFKKLPDIWAIGNTNLLNHKNTVGFCGSRKASDIGIKAAHNCIQELIKKNDNVIIVSGNANGVDLEVHYAALKNGASTILVLPEGLDNFKIKPRLRSVWSWQRVLVISQFDNKAVWRVWQAMQRNDLILALSKAMVVIEAGETGGTKAAADSAIKHETPLFVIDYGENPTGNKNLLQCEGASTIRKNRRTGAANIDHLGKIVFANY